ncbi:hypothetical protein DB30_03196 [Enhygromyxa salina]|uniref:Uncharacterized protein n=1 Tax=Enhygromyxa salina TaxID=215803 RepID=A0A0C2D766_9BACT|nr:hypothetical protein [Enhygromyxa salina]KIG17495.1 hypothetical protein DB30_03196 [Enhygromyxa salina]
MSTVAGPLGPLAGALVGSLAGWLGVSALLLAIMVADECRLLAAPPE